MDERELLNLLLRKLDEVNEVPRLVDFAWNGKQVVGMVAFPPTEARMDQGEFQLLVDALFQCAEDGLEVS